MFNILLTTCKQIPDITTEEVEGAFGKLIRNKPNNTPPSPPSKPRTKQSTANNNNKQRRKISR